MHIMYLVDNNIYIQVKLNQRCGGMGKLQQIKGERMQE